MLTTSPSPTAILVSHPCRAQLCLARKSAFPAPGLYFQAPAQAQSCGGSLPPALPFTLTQCPPQLSWSCTQASLTLHRPAYPPAPGGTRGGAGMGSTPVNHQRAKPPLASRTHSPRGAASAGPRCHRERPQAVVRTGQARPRHGGYLGGSRHEAPEHHPPRVTPVGHTTPRGAEGTPQGGAKPTAAPMPLELLLLLTSGSCSPAWRQLQWHVGRPSPRQSRPAPSSSVGPTEGPYGSTARESPLSPLPQAGTGFGQRAFPSEAPA